MINGSEDEIDRKSLRSLVSGGLGAGCLLGETTTQLLAPRISTEGVRFIYKNDRSDGIGLGCALLRGDMSWRWEAIPENDEFRGENSSEQLDLELAY